MVGLNSQHRKNRQRPRGKGGVNRDRDRGGADSKLELLQQLVAKSSGSRQSSSSRPNTERPRSLLDRVRERQKGGFPQTTRKKDAVRQAVHSEECEALKTENELLKQLVASVKSAAVKNRDQARQLSSLQALQQLQQRPTPLSPLALLANILQSPSDNLPSSSHGSPSSSSLEREVRRVVQQPDFSTVIQTVSYETVVTTEGTKEISLRFQGKWKTTQIVQAVIQTSTITEVLTSLIEVTPTQPIHMTKQTRANQLLPLYPRSSRKDKSEKENITVERKEEKRQRSFPGGRTPKIRPFQRKNDRYKTTPKPSSHGRLSSFKTLQGYLQNIKGKIDGARKSGRNKNIDTQAISRERFQNNPISSSVIEVSIAKNSRQSENQEDKEVSQFGPVDLQNNAGTVTITSDDSHPLKEPSEAQYTRVTTFFLSGSVPGQYTTSLSTITLSDKEETSGSRVKRETLLVSDRIFHTYNELKISPTRTVKLGKEGDLCRVETVTVTVVNTQTCAR